MADPKPAGRSHVVGALFLALGATAGALGAHALEGVLTPNRMESWATASLYLLVMGAALVGAHRQHATELPPRLAGGGRWNGDVFRQHHGPGHAGHNGLGPRIADRIGAHDPRRRRVDDWRVGRLGLASASTLTLKPSRCRQEQVIQKTDQRKGHNRIDHVRHDVRILEPNEVAIRVKNEPCESDGDGSNRAL